MSFKITTDTITPALARLIKESSNPKRVMEAMGTSLVSVTKRAFNDASLRATPWATVKTGRAPLKKSGTLWQSIRIAELTSNSVSVVTDRPYAVYHQFGTKPYVIYPKATKALFWPGAKHPVTKVNHPGLPARPFFPFDAGGRMIPLARRQVELAGQKALDALCRKAQA